VLLVGAVLLLRSFVTLVTVARGYDPDNVITASARRPSTFSAGRPTAEERVEEEASRRRFYTELDEAMAAPDLYDGGGEKAVAAQRELREVTRDLAQAEARWLQLQEQWETSHAA